MAITGTHTLLYSSEPDKLRAMLRDVLSLPHIDIGGGWLLFELPPSEIAVHPADGPTFESGTRHQFTLMCDHLGKTILELKSKGVVVKNEPKEERWGVHVTLGLPGDCDVMLYEPRHPIAAGMSDKASKKSAAPNKTAKKTKARSATLRRDKPGRRAKKAPRRR
ncbi:MAG TPA: hypothetical protein VM096_01920 [Vicinamibacterales bacterium]|nr:hypothetical protein [Vicinamibacterales bacterium]